MRLFNRFIHDPDNVREPNLAGKEACDRYFIGRIQHDGDCSTLFQSRPREPKRGKFVEVRRFEVKASYRGQIEPLRWRFHSLWPPERISNGDAHVRRSELRQHRSVHEFDHRMNYRLRVDEDIDPS